MYDEGPSEEDLERFSTGDAYCPECGASIFDEVEICPACHAFVGGRVRRTPPGSRAAGEIQRRSHLVLIVLLIVLIAGLGGVLIRLF